MEQDPAFQSLLRKSLIALVLCAILVTLCYFLVDRPVAHFVFDHELNRFDVLRWLTYPPPYMEKLAPLVLIALLVRRAWGEYQRWELTLFAVCISLLLTVEIERLLKPVFGRTWPKTWIGENPALIPGGVYGFFPFRPWVWGETDWYDSFPSGHTARVLAIVAVVWIAAPWWRWACVLATVAIAVGLIGMDYHFVGDVIGGGFTGGIVGAYTARFCGVAGASKNPSPPTPLPQGERGE